MIYYSSQKKKQTDAQMGGEGNNAFFNLGGMGTGGADANYDACVAQGQHELK